MLPELTVNRHFMAAFIAADTPCLALGMVEVESRQCALIALRLNQPIPKAVSAAGFAFGHALIGTGTWEVVHFGFAFYGFATYNVLINPSNPTARSVLNTMVETGDYFFFALDSNQGATSFRSEIGRNSLAGLKANMARIERSTTTEAQYRTATAQFASNPQPPGPLLTWVCRDNAGVLDLPEDRLVLRPA
jgi:hypothetical protein